MTKQVASKQSCSPTNSTKNTLQVPKLINSSEKFTKETQNYVHNSIENDQSDTSLCMELSEDFVIPPTPSPVSNTKNTSRISIKTRQTSNHFSTNKESGNYKHIRKPTDAKLAENFNNEDVQTLKVSVKDLKGKDTKCEGNDENLPTYGPFDKVLISVDNCCNFSKDDKMDLDFIDFSVDCKKEICGKTNGVKSIRDTALKLSRKTFKLSKKGKKVDVGNSPRNLGKNVKAEGDIGCQTDSVLLSYGIQASATENGLSKNDKETKDMDACGNEKPSIRVAVRSRKVIFCAQFVFWCMKITTDKTFQLI